jgi:hypothetical protein
VRSGIIPSVLECQMKRCRIILILIGFAVDVEAEKNVKLKRYN